MVVNHRTSNRIKLRDKKLNKIKLCVEKLVIEHGGSYIDNNTNSGAVKTRYTRTVEKEKRVFVYTYHNSISDRMAYVNCRKQLNIHLQKLDIVERLPMLMVRSTATYDADMLAARKSTPIGLAFIAYEDAWKEIEELLDTEDINDLLDTEDDD